MSFCCKEDFTPSNVMDRWILSFTQSLISYAREEMASEWRWYLVKGGMQLVMEGRGCCTTGSCLLKVVRVGKGWVFTEGSGVHS